MPTIWIPPLLRELTGGQNTVTVPGETVRQVIENLESRYPGVKARLCDGERLRPTLSVAVDGTLTSRTLRDSVDEASEVHFIPAIGGGC